MTQPLSAFSFLLPPALSFAVLTYSWCIGVRKRLLPVTERTPRISPQKATFFEISLLRRREMLHQRLTIVSEGTKMIMRFLYHLFGVVVPTLLVLSHSWLGKYSTESRVTKYVPLRPKSPKNATFEVGKVLDQLNIGTRKLHSCILRYILLLLCTGTFSIGPDAKNIFQPQISNQDWTLFLFS